MVGHPPAESPWRPARVAMLLRRFGLRAPALIMRSLRHPTAPPADAHAARDRGSGRCARHSAPQPRPARSRPRLLQARAAGGPMERSSPDRRARVICRAGSSSPRRASPHGAPSSRPSRSGRQPDAGRRDRLGDDAPAREGVDVFFAGRVEDRPAVRTAGLCRAACARAGGRPGRPRDGATRPAGVLPPLRARVDRLVSGRTRMGLLSPLRGAAVRERAAHESGRRSCDTRLFGGGEQALYYDVETGDLARTVRAALADRREAEPDGDRRARDHVQRCHTLERLCEHVVRSGLAGDARRSPALALATDLVTASAPPAMGWIMRLLFVTARPLATAGGIQTLVRSLAGALARVPGVEVSVITGAMPDAPTVPLRGAAAWLRPAAVPLPAHGPPGSRRTRSSSAESCLQGLDQAAAAARPDVLICVSHHSAEAHQAARVAAGLGDSARALAAHPHRRAPAREPNRDGAVPSGGDDRVLLQRRAAVADGGRRAPAGADAAPRVRLLGRGDRRSPPAAPLGPGGRSTLLTVGGVLGPQADRRSGGGGRKARIRRAGGPAHDSGGRPQPRRR